MSPTLNPWAVAVVIVTTWDVRCVAVTGTPANAGLAERFVGDRKLIPSTVLFA
jgi:hypothetical protein